MNETDYLIGEVMSICTGIVIAASFSMFMLLFGVHDILICIIGILFVMFTSFFMGLYFHFKRKLFIYDMQQEIKLHRKDFDKPKE